jgi:cobyrinic acid a,c-diamide synthase
MRLPRLMLAGERSGVGKSTISIGIMAALKGRGLTVQPFKSGPDFLDPMHHTQVCGRASRNLDTWMLRDWTPVSFQRAASDADVSVVEGVMGLYDGLDGRSEEGSSAHLSKVLGCPVVLVVDASSSARSVGAVVKGFATFDPRVDVRGVIFNRVASERHLLMLEDAISGTGIASLGGLPKDGGVGLESRHLGLVPALESDNGGRYALLRELMETHLDVDAIVDIAGDTGEWNPVEEPMMERMGRFDLAVAFDDAFNFYYEDNLDIMKDLGAEITTFSPMKDPLPDADGYYFGGGYPELHLDALEGNREAMEDLLSIIDQGRPVYAECGGMMYLCRKVRGTDGRSHAMVGAFKADTMMTERCQAIGYTDVLCIKDSLLAKRGQRFRGHVFHYSKVDGCEESDFAYSLDRKKGAEGPLDGFVRDHTLASYTHVHLGNDIHLGINWARACLGQHRQGR